MILVALGSNLNSPEFGPPVQVLEAAMRFMSQSGLRVDERSPWYRTAPVPISDQPWFVNGVVQIESALAPQALLAMLHRIEARMGRRRLVRWEARIVDLDLLAYDDRIIAENDSGSLVLPHPRMTDRAFVMAPLADLAPDWRHPVSGRSAREILAELKLEEEIERLAE